MGVPGSGRGTKKVQREVEEMKWGRVNDKSPVKLVCLTNIVVGV